MFLKVAFCFIIVLEALLLTSVDAVTASHHDENLSTNMRVVEGWAAQIMDLQHHPVIYAELESRVNTSKTIDLLDAAVKSAYNGELQNVQTILHFINGTSLPLCKFQGYKALFTTMIDWQHDRTKEMMGLIYYVKEAISDKAIITDEQVMSNYNALKAIFPKDMSAIIFADLVNIKNRYYDEYLFESSYEEDKHRLILSWRPGSVVLQSYFYFHAVMGSNGVLKFFIRNDHYSTGYTLCLSDKYYDKNNNDRRYTVTCSSGYSDVDAWYIEPYGSYFTIKSYWTGNYLYAPDNDHVKDNDRRWIFTWGGGGDMQGTVNFHWAIINR